ncbi:MAG: autotransporter-associated beta strand repeat-containing protein [Kiritimatiellia bacterium]
MAFLGYGGLTVNVTGTPASTWNADIRWGSASGLPSDNTTINIATGSSLIVAGHLGHFEGSQWAFLNLTGGGTLIMTDGTGNQNTPTIGANATMQIGNGGTTGDLPNGAVNGAGKSPTTAPAFLQSQQRLCPIRVISGTGQVVQNGGGTAAPSPRPTPTRAARSSTAVPPRPGSSQLPTPTGPSGNNSAVTMANAAGATLDITGFNTQIGSLTGGGATGGRNVTLGAATDHRRQQHQSGRVRGTISGTGGVTKIGTGVQTFSGSNSYTGVTTVSAGVLKLDQRRGAARRNRRHGRDQRADLQRRGHRTGRRQLHPRPGDRGNGHRRNLHRGRRVGRLRGGPDGQSGRERRHRGMGCGRRRVQRADADPGRRQRHEHGGSPESPRSGLGGANRPGGQRRRLRGRDSQRRALSGPAA